MLSVKASVHDIIHKPIDEVYKHIVKKDLLCKYFVSETDADLVESTRVNWTFEDVGVTLEVSVVQLIENKKIQFKWQPLDHEAKDVVIMLEAYRDSTRITIEEFYYDASNEGYKQVMNQTQGWTDFICSLKAYMYASINLRTGQHYK